MKILVIIKNDLIKMAREKSSIILMFLMPVMFILIFGNLNFGDGNDPMIPVGITNLDGSSVSYDFVSELKKDKTIMIIELDEEELYNQVKNSDITAGFIIPADFNKKIKDGNRPEINVIKLPSSTDYPAIAGIISSAYLKLDVKNSVIEYFNDKMKNVSAENKNLVISDIGNKVEEYLNLPPLVSVDSKIYSQKTVRKVSQKTTYTLSFSIVFIMWTIIFAAGEILLERKNNTWGRLNMTPTSKSTIFLGKVTGTFIRGWIQITFLILFGKLVMGVDFGSSILMTFLIFSIFLFCITSFGILMAAIVKTYAQLAAMSSIIITCTSMLAGCYWPLEIMPDVMQKLAKIFPQYWVLKALTANLENLGSDAIVLPLVILSGMGVLFYLISIIIGRLRISIKNTVKTKNLVENV